MDIITKTLDRFLDLKPNQFIFDIETTGLNSKYNKVILIGIVFNEDNNTIIKQFFANTPSEEYDLLLHFVDFIKLFNSHISFNGFNFDIPFINYRLKKHEIDFSLSKDDGIDILKLIKPFKEKLSLSDCKLKTIEKYLDINRSDTISGKDSVYLYKEFEKSQDNGLKSKILLHNYDDIYYLGVIFNNLDIIEKKLDSVLITINHSTVSITPVSFKFIKDTLIVDYISFKEDFPPIAIYENLYSITSNKNILKLSLSIESALDKDSNIILFFRANKIIILKVDNTVIYNNILTLCNFILNKSINSL